METPQNILPVDAIDVGGGEKKGWNGLFTDAKLYGSQI